MTIIYELMISFSAQKFEKPITQLSSILAEQRFNMEEDRKGRGREKSPLCFNIIAAQLRLNSTKVKNYNLNVTENLVSDFKNAFSGIFDFTVGILI